MTTATNTDRRRDEFGPLDDSIHLLSHSLGPMPLGVTDSMQAYCAIWNGQTDEDAWSRQWWMLSQEVGDLYARIIGAPAGSVLPVPNATLAMATVASCLDFEKRPKVVISALDFPSMGYLWNAQATRGAEIVTVPSDDGISIDSDRIADAVDERTAIVAVSHVSYRSSARIDPAPIVAKARSVGALSLFDIYQSAGVVAIDATAWNADFLVGGSIKWLCGGPSAGYLYVRPDIVGDLRPRLTGWIAHENPFAFSHDPICYDSTVRRFSQGTPPIPSLYSVIPGMKIINAVGVPAIEAESQKRTQFIIERASEAGWPVGSPRLASNRGGTVMLGFEDPETVASKLRAQRVLVDWRPGVGIRLSPNFFNSDEEIDQALDSIAASAS